MKKFFLAICLSALIAGAAAAQDLSPRISENTVQTAVTFYDDGKFKDAATLLEALLERDADNDAAHFYLGMSYVYLKKYDEAEVHLSRAAELDNGNFWYRYRLATLYSLTGRGEITLSMYEKMLEDFPDRNELYYNLVELYTAAGNMDRALETIDKIETVFGRNESTVMSRFDIMMHQKRQEEAYKSLEEYNREYSSPMVLATLGDWELSMGNDSTAMAHYDEALAIAPDFAPAKLGRAEAFRIERKYDKFFPAFYEIMADEALSPAGKADYLRGMFSAMDGRFIKAYREQIDSVLALGIAAHPKDSSMLYVAGSYYFTTDRKELARMCFNNNRLVNPTPSAWGAYCDLLGRMEKWEELSQTALEGHSKFPDDDYFISAAIAAEYQRGNLENVVHISSMQYDEAVASGNRKAQVEALGNIGDIYHQAGDMKGAYKYYKKALKVDPSYCPVLNNYAYFLALSGKKLKKAYQMSSRTIEAEPDNPTYLDTFGWILHLMGRDVEAKAIFKHAMLYGAKESAECCNHYAEVLEALGEKDLAKVYRRN